MNSKKNYDANSVLLCKGIYFTCNPSNVAKESKIYAFVYLMDIVAEYCFSFKNTFKANYVEDKLMRPIKLRMKNSKILD